MINPNIYLFFGLLSFYIFLFSLFLFIKNIFMTSNFYKKHFIKIMLFNLIICVSALVVSVNSSPEAFVKKTTVCSGASLQIKNACMNFDLVKTMNDLYFIYKINKHSPNLYPQKERNMKALLFLSISQFFLYLSLIFNLIGIMPEKKPLKKINRGLFS
jgi:hypothetical protein